MVCLHIVPIVLSECTAAVHVAMMFQSIAWPKVDFETTRRRFGQEVRPVESCSHSLFEFLGDRNGSRLHQDGLVLRRDVK